MSGAIQAFALAFKNEHLSVSRLKLFEQCQRAFFYRYVSKGAVEGRGNAADFGVVLHAALEIVYRWILDEMHEGLFPVDVLLEGYRAAWSVSGLTGVALYQEGLQILRVYAASHSIVDHMAILDTEREFNVDVGGFVVNGYIDLLEKAGPEHVRVVDFKSNRKLFSQDELETDLQMSVYGLAVRSLYPWAKKVTFVFEMLRHDQRQGTERTAKEIDDAAGYVVALGKRSESLGTREEAWTPTLNSNCSYCDARRRCPEYARALSGQYEVTKVQNTADFAEVAVVRETLAKLAKVMYGKKGELDDLIRAKIDHEGEFEAGGFKYRMISGGSTKTYAPSSVLQTFAGVGMSVEEVARRVLKVDPKAVEVLRLEMLDKLDRSKGHILTATLEGLAQMDPNAPRLDSREVKTAKKVRERDEAGEAKEVEKAAARGKKAVKTP